MDNKFTYCQKCGEKHSTASSVCQKCLSSLNDVIQQPSQVQPQYVPQYQPQNIQQHYIPTKQNSKGLSPGKGVLIGILAIVIMLTMLVITFSIIDWAYNDLKHKNVAVSSTTFEVAEEEVIDFANLQNYSWGNVVKQIFSSVGVDDVEEIIVEISNAEVTTFRITTSTTKLWLSVKQNNSDIWYVEWLKNYENTGKHYYICEEDKYDDEHLLLEDIYSYKTGNLLEKKVVETSPDLIEIVKAKVGEIVYLGKFEQDNNTNNGKEKIAWRVLDVETDKVMLISKDILIGKAYNDEEGYTSGTWLTSPLRSWLNDEFLNSAFSSIEQKAIDLTHAVNNDNPNGTDGGNDTFDYVFLLSYEEFDKYLNYNTSQASGTKYAKSNGLYVETSGNYSGYSEWWLRSPGSYQYFAGFVKLNGVFSYAGHVTTLANVGVRPVIWIDL